MLAFVLKEDYLIKGIPALVMELHENREAFIVYNPNSGKYEAGVCSSRNEFDFVEYDTLLQVANMLPYVVGLCDLANYESIILAKIKN